MPFFFLLLSLSILFGPFVLGTRLIFADQLTIVHHDIKTSIDPEKQFVKIQDTINLPETMLPPSGEKLHFLLHGGLNPISKTDGVTVILEKEKAKPSDFGMEKSIRTDPRVPANHYSVNLPKGVHTFSLEYSGKISHPIQIQGEEYARSFSETPGIISAEGVFLSSSSLWYPLFNDEFLSFSIEAKIPKGWDVVSQGDRLAHDFKEGQRVVSWNSPQPQEEIFLVGGPFTEYDRTAGSVSVMAFLREPDKDLAEKYLETAGQYLEMYRNLIGPYPYGKFALVENFWDTGYGMPSFTLLGSRIIRFPFILHSSFPHEILHNWWGNGVFVDSESGNWSEGLTAYLADQLVQEQRGTGRDSRRAILQKYADYVSEGRDFPIVEFHGRHSAATEAVGYGKTLMVFHMLRQQLGDETFVRALQTFYRQSKFKRATFDDLERVFSSVSGRDLRTEFRQWITKAGAPVLNVSDPVVQKTDAGYSLSATIEQKQKGPAYHLYVPVAAYLEGQEKAYQTVLEISSKQYQLNLQLSGKPKRLEVDPEFDLFRKLDVNEIPPALSGALGAEKALIVLPAAAPEPIRHSYQEMAEEWKKGQSQKIEIKWDKEIKELPSEGAVWLFGWENRFQPEVRAALNGFNTDISTKAIRINNKEIIRPNHSIAMAAKNPRNPAATLAWVATDMSVAVPGLGRKLPHYGRYGYLAFEGEEPVNVEKGEWSVNSSPMSVQLVKEPQGGPAVVSGKLAPRAALASLPSIFSEDRMIKDIEFLSNEKLKGRGFGTNELREAAEYIALQFKTAGLKPGGDVPESYFQTFKAKGGEPEREAVLENVVAILPGSKPELSGQSVVVGAHYDHLGLGWPNVSNKEKGKIHPGADDNASGIAILLELARLMGKTQPDRTVVFVAFSGEELGALGSQYYVTHEKIYPPEKIIGMLNMDTVGRLGNNKLTIFGTGTAREWVHIFRGAGFVTGVQIEQVTNDIGASDHKSFVDAGVPGVQFFSGANLDYHKPTDTPDKIDRSGLVKVGSVVKEAVEYLSSRPEPLHSTITGSKEAVPAPPFQGPARKASLGTIPDFNYSGKGVRIGGVNPTSPAASAGLKEGDVITKLNDQNIEDLRAYSEALKKVQPGDSLSVTFTRDGKEQTVKATAVER